MECPTCGTDNKPDAVFCMSCGASLPDVPFAQLEKKAYSRPPEGAAQPERPQAGAGPGGEATSAGGFILGAEAASPRAPAGPEPAPAPPATPPQPPAPGEGRVSPTAATTSMPQAGAPGAAPTPAGPPAQQPRSEGPIPPGPAAPPAAPAPPAAGMQSVVEEIGGKPQAPQAAPPQAAPTPATTPTQAPAAPARAPADETRVAPPIPAPKVEAPAPAQAPAPLIAPTTPAPRGKEDYYIPPEADYDIAAPVVKPVEAEPQPVLPQQVPPTVPPSLDSTQEVAAIIAAGAAAGAAKGKRSVCPECYAPNPEGNSYCQECGSALPLTTGRTSEAARAAPGKPAAEQTAVLPTASQGAAAQPVYAGQLPKARKAYGDRAFGVADVLALFAVGAAAVAIALSYALDSFAWKKGVDIAMFSHQGAYTQGRTDLLGGPGLLPYAGAEFFTVGMVVAIGLALALVFLAVRVGRGPMYVLSGCILLLPVAYLLFQAILPLRQMGIEVDASVGLSGMFFGNAAAPGMGPPIWLITGAGVLLVVAGFMAPPRGWGRLFTFLLFFSIVLGIAFFCAACFNWNLFISEPAALTALAAKPPASSLVCPWALFA